MRRLAILAAALALALAGVGVAHASAGDGTMHLARAGTAPFLSVAVAKAAG